MPHDPNTWTHWRDRLSLTQAQLAETVGVDTSTITHIERGRRAPSVAVLNRLCDALGLTPDERADALRMAAEPPIQAGAA